MKTPQFEEMAARWRAIADVDVFIVYSREAHPEARGLERLSAAADALMAMDQDGDDVISREEFEGPEAMFAPFDVDNDGQIHPAELLAARKISQFEGIAAPTTMDERRALARRFRAEVPGAIPLLVDELDDRVSAAYGGRPNSAFVITGGAVTHAFEWASVRATEAALAELTGREAPPPAQEIDGQTWAVVAEPLEAARAAGRPLLIQFTAPGCPACEAMKAGTLADAEIRQRLAGFERATLGVEEDRAWALFEALDLAATPAFVIVDPAGPEVRGRSQGRSAIDEFGAFLAEE